MRVVGYCRFSSENQRDGYSIEAQKRAIEDHCEREAYTLVDWFVDEARSGTNDDREAFQSMIADSASKRFQAVVVHKLDRFARDRYDSAVYKKKLKDNGVRVISVLEPLDDSPESIMMESVLEGMAEYYSRNLSREVLKGKRVAAANAQHQGGMPPYGVFVKDDMTYGVVPEEAVVIREMFDLAEAGHTFAEISRQLKDKGIKNRAGNYLGKGFVARALQNPLYMGQFVFGKNSTKGTWVVVDDALEAIVTKDQFDRVNQVIEKRVKPYKEAQQRAIARNKGDDYILTGIAFCGVCGSHLHGFRSHKKYKNAGGQVREYSNKFYRCAHKVSRERVLTDTITPSCSFKNIKKEDLEDFVLRATEAVIFSDKSMELIVDKVRARLKERLDANSDQAALVKEIEKIKRQQQRLLDLYLDGSMEIPTYNSRKAELASNLDFYLDKLARTQVAKPDMITLDLVKSRIAAFLKSAKADSLEYQKLLLTTFVDSVVADNENVVIYFKFPLPTIDQDTQSFVRKRTTLSTSDV
jgi:site-specific DNA recombinase